MNISEIIETKKKLEQIKKEADSKLQELEFLQISMNDQEKVIKRVADSLEKGISDFVEKEKFIKFFEKPYALIPTIEIDFLYGSRQQELQRTGRLMHSEEKDVRHDIIMTSQELESYGKRLWSLQEKGFTIKIIEEDLK